MEKEKISNQAPKLINDVPTSEDRFDSHKRIAVAVETLIENNTGGKSISIEGKWGSGKSSVIKLLEDSLLDKKDKKLINYDTWSHSGDPLRRSFLNTIINELVDNKWLHEPDDEFIKKHKILSNRGKISASYKDKGFWEFVKDCLSGKFKTTQKNVTPILEPEGQLLVVLMMILPVATLFVVNMYRGYIMDDYFFIDWPYWIHFFFAVCVFFIIAPFLHIFLLKRNSSGGNILLSIYNKTVNEELTSTVEAPEPTTIEFQEVFSSVMDMALRDASRRVVIVIDNLDRLDEQEADNVWSLLRSFIDPSSFNVKKHPWIERIWVVVPLATNTKAKEVNKGHTVDDAKPSDEEEQQIREPEQVLDKVFQVRFRIPPPVLTNWESYMYELLDSAFGRENISLEDKKKVYWLYDHYRNQVVKSKATPRALILFVNELVTMKTLWGNSFPLTTLAAFSVDSKRKDILSALESRKIPSQTSLQLLGPEIREAYASIFFNVNDNAKALNLLFTPLMESYLKDGKNDDLLNLLKNEKYSVKFFVNNLRKWLQDWVHVDKYAFFNAVITVAKLAQDKDKDSFLFLDASELSIVGQSVKSNLENIDYLPLDLNNIVNGYEAFVEISEDSIAAKIFVNALVKNSQLELNNYAIHTQLLDHSDNCIKNINQLVKGSSFTDELEKYKNFSIPLPFKFSDWLEICEENSEDHFNKWKKFKPQESHSDIASRLIGLENNSFSEDSLSALNWIAKTKNLKNYSYVLDIIEEKLKSVTVANDEVKLIVNFLVTNYKTDKNIQSLSNSILNNGGYYLQVVQARDFETVAELLCLILLTDISVPDIGGSSNAQAGYKKINQILTSTVVLNDSETTTLAHIIESCKLERLFIDLACLKFDSYDNISAVVSKISNVNNIYKEFNIEDVSHELFRYVHSYINQKPEVLRTEITKYLINSKQLIVEILKDKLQLQNCYLYTSIFMLNSKTSAPLTEALIVLISSLTTEQWYEKLSLNSSLLNLIYTLKKEKVNFQLGKELCDSLLQLFKENKQLTTLQKIGIKAAIYYLDSKHNRKLEAGLIKAIENTSEAFHESTWLTFSDTTIGYLENPTGKKKIASVLLKLIETDDYFGLDLIVKSLRKHKGLINPHEKAYSILRSKMTQKINSGATSEQEKVLNKIKRCIQRTRLVGK